MAYPADYEELNPPVVIDNGTGVIKAGFGGGETPTHLLPAIVGQPKHKRVIVQGSEMDKFVGKKAFDKRGILKLSYPMQHGIVVNWDQMTQLWEEVYELMKTEKSEHPVLLTEAPLNPTNNRSQLCDIFFDQFNVPALFVAEQAVLSLYATGRTTGAVLDSGHGVTHCVPVYEGFALPHAITRMDVAGADVTEYLNQLLRKSNINFHTSSEMETVRILKEQKCELAFAPGGINQTDEHMALTPFTLPDGKKIMIGKARFQAPELLFDPSLIGKEYRGVQHCVLDSISKADLDLRAMLYSSIVISGGSTCFKGFPERLFAECRQGKPQSAKLRIFAPQDRINSTWIGGSILSYLPAFRQMWIHRKEYQENGVSILHRKSFL